MDLPMLKRLPCSVCGLVTFGHRSWFLVMENRWLDLLKIFTWHPSLARDQHARSACCRQHLKVLLAYWLEQASFQLASPGYPQPIPLAATGEETGPDTDPKFLGRLVGELSVCREPLSRSWSGSPEALECILDALIPEQAESKPVPPAPRVFDPRRARPFPGFALH